MAENVSKNVCMVCMEVNKAHGSAISISVRFIIECTDFSWHLDGAFLLLILPLNL